jgi:uncharacterized protein YndB with AHSA1/START domain
MERISTQRNIQASPSKVQQALTSQTGLRGWWTGDCEVKGDEATFRFAKEGGVMELRFRVDEAKPDSVKWTCVAQQNNPEWEGTQVSFSLSPTHDGTRVDFNHLGWPKKSQVYEMCVGGWDHFMNSLKSYVETGKGTPFGA